MDKLQIESDDDGDLSDIELSSMFSVPYHLQSEVAVATQTTYILHMSGNLISSPRVAVALSDLTCAIYDVLQLTKLDTLRGHKGTVTNVKFDADSDNLVYSSSSDGTIKVWDLRIGNKCAKEFKDDSDGSEKLKPLLDFDISCNNRFMCGGTELMDEDAFLLFWDIRSTKLLGGYWESHTDDITQVCFHPTNQDVLASGSTDGLINTFDVSKTSEDDALLQSLNTESSVEKIGSIEQESGVDALFCVTHTEDLQLWTTDGAYPYQQFSREKISQSMQRKSSESCFIIDAHKTNNPGELLLLTGSTIGRGECLRTLAVCKKLKPLSNLVGNKQIVRTSWFNRNNELLLTGGESGILSVWEPGSSSEKVSGTTLKMNTKEKFIHHQSRPY